MLYVSKEDCKFHLLFYTGLLNTDLNNKQEVNSIVKKLKTHPGKTFLVKSYIKAFTEKEFRFPLNEVNVKAINFLIFYYNCLLNLDISNKNKIEETIKKIENYHYPKTYTGPDFKKDCIKAFKYSLKNLTP